MTTVTIDGVAFVDTGETGRVYTRLAGWYGSPPVRADAVERPGADGAFSVSKAYRSPRSVTFEGNLFGASSNAAMVLWSEFAGVQSSGAPVTITVEDDFGLLSAVASLDGPVSIEAISRDSASVTATFICYDPIKYGPVRTLTTGLPTSGGGLTYELFEPDGELDYGANGLLGRVTLTNVGTAAVYPKFTVTGALTTGFFVQRLDTGQRLRYDRVVPAGSNVVIDSRTGSVVVDGTSDGSTYLTVAEFFAVEAGASFDVQFNAIGGSSGTPLLAAQISDGYW